MALKRCTSTEHIFIIIIIIILTSVSMFPREFKNWQYKMKVGTTINLCDQRPADSRAVVQENYYYYY